MICEHGIRVGTPCLHCDAVDSATVAVVGNRPDRPDFVSEQSIPNDSSQRTHHPQARPQESPLADLGAEAPLGDTTPEQRRSYALNRAAGLARSAFEAVNLAVRELKAISPVWPDEVPDPDVVLKQVRALAEASEGLAKDYRP